VGEGLGDSVTKKTMKGKKRVQQRDLEGTAIVRRRQDHEAGLQGQKGQKRVPTSRKKNTNKRGKMLERTGGKAGAGERGPRLSGGNLMKTNKLKERGTGERVRKDKVGPRKKSILSAIPTTKKTTGNYNAACL